MVNGNEGIGSGYQGPRTGIEKFSLSNIFYNLKRILKGLPGIILTLAVIVIILFLLLSLFFWATSDRGQRGISDFGNYILDTIQSQFTQRLSSIEEKATLGGAAKDVRVQSGIILKALTLAGGTSVPSGEDFPVIYNFDIGVQEVRLENPVEVELKCEIKPKTAKSVIKGEIEYSSKPLIPKGGNLKIDNFFCKFKTESLSKNRKISVEGFITFPYETKDATATAYFAEESYGAFESDTFEKMVTDYHGEPVAIVFDMESPGIIGLGKQTTIFINYIPRWGGSIIELNDASLILPPGFTLFESDEYKLPTRQCPFNPKFSVKDRKNVYSADKEALKIYEEISPLKATKKHTLSCPVTSTISIGPVAKSAQIEASVSYKYKSLKKIGPSLTLLKSPEKTKDTTSTEKPGEGSAATGGETSETPSSEEDDSGKDEEPFETPIDLGA